MHRENIDQLGVNEGSNARSVLALQRERQLSEGPPSAAVACALWPTAPPHPSGNCP